MNKYVGLDTIDKLALAFLMNLTTTISSMYALFTSIMSASANCDYSSVAQKVGSLFKRIVDFNKDLLGHGHD
jgi:hypothetical protein